MLLSLLGACQSERDPKRLDALVAPAFRPNAPGGVVLVARNDQVLFRRAYGMADLELGVAMQPDHVLATGSITKQFTAVAILRLAAEGKLALDDDVRRYVPGFETHGHRVTIEQVLTHTAGLPNLVDLPDFEARARLPHSVEELLALTSHLPLHFTPGTGFRYSDTGYILLGAVIERLGGMPYGDYLEQHLFRPLGMRDTWYGDDRRIIPKRAKGHTERDGRAVHPDPMSMTVPHAAGAIVSTADDLLIWDRALRSGRVIPAELLEMAWSPRTLPDGRLVNYGFGWKLCTFEGRPTIEHGGFVNGFLAAQVRLPDDEITVIVLANNDADRPDPGALFRRIARQLLTGSPDLQEVRLTETQRSALLGTYRVDSSSTITISIGDSGLRLQWDHGRLHPLTAISPTELTLTESEGALVFRFTLESRGRAARVDSVLRCEPRETGVRVDG